jgi:Concanavalin A-like lectin/glucanases superfamily
MKAFARTTVLLSVACLSIQGRSADIPVGSNRAGEPIARWSWQAPHSKVLPTGDLQWAPEPFEFKAGESKRYIDFDSGNDTNNGSAKERPWKHHPWDPNASDQAKACKGAHTYVFKQGVVYRGEMDATESGSEAMPIILTRDPSWGTGPAVICGSESVTSWKQGADNPLIPEPGKVWYADLDWAPRNVWMVGKDGAVTRITLARTPNWAITDPEDIKSEWWTWKNPGKPFDNYTTINGQRRHLAFDKEHINSSQAQDYYLGAIVWTTKGWVMGNPFPARVLAVDREKGSLTFAGQWGGEPSYKIIRGCQYYLEDKPQFLDSPGEFWFDKKGSGGRLYIRLPGDQDPNTAQVEVGRRIHMIDSRGMSHVRVRGLTFRFANVYWNLIAAPYWVSHESLDVQPGCVRLLGSGTDLEVSHCTFEHVHKGVRLKAMGREDAIDHVVVEDNVFSDADSGGVELADSTTYGDVAPPMGRLYDVRVLRNRFDHIGLRPDLFSQGTALAVEYAETAEVAGNMFERICAQGIDVHGAKASGAATDRPFARILIHHNKAVDTLINVDDFGGIETWQGGPAYVYDNISGNPGGYRNWDHVLSPDTEDRFGHAYYLDGAFKDYYFNNIAWGKSKGPSGKLANTAAFQEIISYQNTFFNNTSYNFVRGSRRQDPQAGRVKFLGNIWQSMGLRVFRDADPARTAAGSGAGARQSGNQFAIDTDAYARNVFYDVGESFGVFEPSGQWHQTVQAFRQALETYQPLAAEVGLMAEQSPLRNAAAHDFRPSANSAAQGLGAKVFVPWSLYETVAEWNFYPIPGDPTRILDEHWCMSPYYTGRDDYYKLPTYPLKGVNISLKDYQDGPLENWTTGALHFNGDNQYAVLANEDICRSVTLDARGGNETLKRTVSGADLSSPQIYTSNFLIEIVFKIASGQTNATLVEKMNGVGWALGVNQGGGVSLTAKSGSVSGTLGSGTAVNDGQWHHVIAEVDRKARTCALYVDGKPSASGGSGIGADVSLANDADLCVGGTPKGHNLNGAIEFLRIARGTLADSKTTISELYAWEFNGPFLEDFTGRRRPANGGCAGAIDDEAHPTNAGRQPSKTP